MRTVCNRGMTLMEIMLANAIFSTVIIGALVFMLSISQSSSVEYQALTLEQDANRVLEEMAHTLRAAKVTARGTEPDDLDPENGKMEAGQLCFQVPVDHDEDGDTTSVDATGQLVPEWGAKREDRFPSDYVDGFIVYRFNGTRVFQEASRNIDLNRDGDTTDEFDIGHMEIEYTDGGTHLGIAPPANSVSVNMMSGNAIVRVRDQVIGDIDGDGGDDPMFAINPQGNLAKSGTVLTITVFTSKPEERIPLLLKTVTSIELRNQ